MPCYHPISGYYSATRNANGKRSVVFSRSGALVDRPVTIPCGRCIGCRLERSRQWAVRCVHESSLHADNCFITLTYDNSNLPSDGSLDISHFQKFMKRLRKRLGKAGKRVRFFHCGEYGETFGRPHYHACLFGYDFPDKELYKEVNGCKLYTSKILQELWPFGFSTIGDVTFESAAYVARYVMKKVTGPMAEDHYSRVDLDTGEVFSISPEYVTMSRRPGIGAGWLDKFEGDVYPSDFLVLRGVKMRPPRFYDNRYELVDPVALDKLKAKRCREGKKFVDNSTPERLHVREVVQRARLTQLKRSVE